MQAQRAGTCKRWQRSRDNESEMQAMKGTKPCLIHGSWLALSVASLSLNDPAACQDTELFFCALKRFLPGLKPTISGEKPIWRHDEEVAILVRTLDFQTNSAVTAFVPGGLKTPAARGSEDLGLSCCKDGFRGSGLCVPDWSRK